MAEKTPREKTLANVRDTLNRRTKRDIPTMPSTSAMLLQDSEDHLWQNNNEDHQDPVNEVQQTPIKAQEQYQSSDDEELGLLTQYIGLARGQSSSQPTKTATTETVELAKLKRTFLEATDIIDRANNHKSKKQSEPEKFHQN